MKLANTIIYYADSNQLHPFLLRQELESVCPQIQVNCFNNTDGLVNQLMQQAMYLEESTHQHVLLIDADLPDIETSSLEELIRHQFVKLKTYLVFTDASRITECKTDWLSGFLRKPVTAELVQNVCGLVCNN